MKPIFTFEMLQERCEKKNTYGTQELNNLNEEQKNGLKHEVSNWGESNLSQTKDILAKYFKLEVNDDFLKDVFTENLSLAYEAFRTAISDTICRDELIEVILQKIDMPSWPIYAEGKEKAEEFHKQLDEALPKHQIRRKM